MTLVTSGTDKISNHSAYNATLHEANAKLADAAADMLAALQGVQTMSNCGQLDEFLGEPWLKAVTAAIAKAAT